MGPLGAGPGALHGAALVWTELAGRFDAEGAGPAEPGAAGDGGDAVTRLGRTNTLNSLIITNLASSLTWWTQILHLSQNTISLDSSESGYNCKI